MNHALFLRQKDGKTGVDLSDGEGYKHCWRRGIGCVGMD